MIVNAASQGDPVGRSDTGASSIATPSAASLRAIAPPRTVGSMVLMSDNERIAAGALDHPATLRTRGTRSGTRWPASRTVPGLLP